MKYSPMPTCPLSVLLISEPEDSPVKGTSFLTKYKIQNLKQELELELENFILHGL